MRWALTKLKSKPRKNQTDDNLCQNQVQQPLKESNKIQHLKTIFFFSFIFISWRLITLQYCSGFCRTLTWISHGFTCIPHPALPSYLPLYPIPLGLPSAPGPSTCLMHPTWAVDLLHPWLYTCFNAVLLKHPTLTFSQSPKVCSVHLCLSVLHIGLSLHLSKFCMYVLVYCNGLYLSGLLHSV